MRKKVKDFSIVVSALCMGLLGCGTQPNEPKEGSLIANQNQAQQGDGDDWFSEIVTLSNEQYPDNPDIGREHPDFGKLNLNQVRLWQRTEQPAIKIDPLAFSISFQGKEDTIFFNSLNIKEFIPQTTDKLKEDSYLRQIALINQEWNRNQVKFKEESFVLNGTNTAGISRIDIARNCLNAYLWEIIVYKEDQGQDKVYYHGWFDFPHELYQALFERINGIPFNSIAMHLEDWKDPDSKWINAKVLRELKDSTVLKFENHNNEAYQKIGERDKKFKNIIYPQNTATIQDYLTDSTLFATFTPPGFYTTKDPRKTQLSRLGKLNEIKKKSVVSANSKKKGLLELELVFHKGDSLETRLVIGGIDPKDWQVLKANNLHKGWQSSMGFNNHTFYESYEHMLANPVASNPYYSYLCDNEGKWLDSHQIGIDGPLFYIDQQDKKVHLLILSFERHSIVGHYSFDL